MDIIIPQQEPKTWMMDIDGSATPVEEDFYADLEETHDKAHPSFKTNAKAKRQYSKYKQGGPKRTFSY